MKRRDAPRSPVDPHAGGFRPRLAAVAVAACFAAHGALALPTAPQVAAGAATFNQTGNQLTIGNTPGTIINWNAFSIDALESVRFDQQHSLSAVLNRVTGGDVSRILGELSSNGRVFLINPNGILFGAGSRVDVHGLIASTLDLADQDFLVGKLDFRAGSVTGGIKNTGRLEAGAGNIYLIAPDIENSGIVRAPNGAVLLAAGRQVSLVDAAHPDIQVIVSAPEDRAANLGELVAGRISVFGALIHNRGTASADRVEVDDHGRIVFRASGDTIVDGGRLSATHVNGQGGQIEVLGNRVAVAGDALIDASGASGGGTILVGGDYQGKNPAVPNAEATFFGPAATLRADATKVGPGGTVIVWADETTRAHGNISARGGSIGGNGGLIETSAHYLDVSGIRVDTRAPQGHAGTWLLDPADITITGGTGDGVTPPDGSGTFAGYYGGSLGVILASDDGPTIVYESEIEGLSAGTNISLAATNSVTTSGTFTGGVTLPNNSNLSITTTDVYGGGITLGTPFTASGTGTITLHSAGNIQQNANITATGTGSIYLDAVGNIAMGTLGAGNTVTTQTNGGAIDYTSSGSIALGRLSAGGGSVNVDAANAILDNNGTNLNISAAEATLYSQYGGAAGGLAISANTQVGSLSAYAAVLGGNYGSISLTNSGTLTNVSMQSSGTAESDVSLTSTGSITLSGDGQSISGSGTTIVRSTGGDVTVVDYATISGASVQVEASGSVNVNGGSITTAYGGSATITAGGNINVSGGSSNGTISAGNLSLTAQTGKLVLTSGVDPNAAAVSAETLITLAVPSLSSGGYVIDGIEGGSTISSLNDNTGIFVASSPAIVGSNFLITYGALPTSYLVNTLLGGGTAYHSYGQTPTASFTYSLSPTVQAGETVSGTPAFSPTVDSLTPAGSFTIYYAGGLTSSVGSSFSAGAGLSYTVNPAMLNATLTGVTKVYDGNTTAFLAPENFLLTGFASGEGATVSQTVGAYDTKNAGTAVPVSATLTPDHFALTGSTSLANYVLPTAATGLGAITQRPSVTWSGGTSGNWSLASNWEAGALPDLANVAQVIIPAGNTVVFDGLNVNLGGMQSAGTVVLQSGTLGVDGNLATAGYQQSGGLLTGAGSLSVTDSFAKSGGSITLAGPVSINQTSGNLVFFNDHPLVLGATTALAGNIHIDAIGGIQVAGPVRAPAGTVTLAAHSPLVIDSAITAASDITLSASDNVYQNADIGTSGGAVSVTAETGSILMTAGTTTSSQGGNISYAAPLGNIQLALLNAGSGNIYLLAGGNVTSAPGQIGPNLIGNTAYLTVGGDAILTANVFSIAGTVGGILYLNNFGTIISSVTETPHPVYGTLEQMVTCLVDPVACGTIGGSSTAQSAINEIHLTQQWVVDRTDEGDEEQASGQQGTGIPTQTAQDINGDAKQNYCN